MKVSKLCTVLLIFFIISCGPPNPGAWRVSEFESTSDGKCKYEWYISDGGRDGVEYRIIDSCGKWKVGDTLIFKTGKELKNEKKSIWEDYGWKFIPMDSVDSMYIKSPISH